MSRGNSYTCRVCGKQYRYCPRCVLHPVDYLMDSFCCEEHQRVFSILSKHTFGKLSSSEAADALLEYNGFDSFRQSLRDHIDRIFEEAVQIETLADED